MIRLTLSFAALSLLSLAAAVAYPPLTAFGHASYDYSTPDDGEVVTESPAELNAFFSNDIRREEGTYYLRVLNDSGTQVSDGNGLLNDDDRTNIVAPIPNLLPDGRYSVHWKTLSDGDGDEAQGVYCFYINVQPTAQQIDECNAMGNLERDATGTANASLDETPDPGATSAPTSRPGASPTAANDSNEEDGGSNTAIIVVIVVAVAAVLAVGAGAAFYSRQRP